MNARGTSRSFPRARKLGAGLENPWAPLLVVSLTLATVVVVGVSSGADARVVRGSALLVLDFFILTGGVLLYTSWRLSRSPAVGWMAVIMVGLGLSEIPVVLLTLADPWFTTTPASESLEVVAALFNVVTLACGVRGVRFTLIGPLTLGFLVAAALLALRFGLADWLPLPADWQDGSAPEQRLLALVLVVVLVVLTMRLPDLSRHVRITCAVVVGVLTAAAALDQSTKAGGAHLDVVLAVLLAVGIGEATLSATLRVTVQTVRERLEEQVVLAARAATAEQDTATRAAALAAVRSTIAPLVGASHDLGRTDQDPERVRELATTLRSEMSRARGLLHGEGGTR